MSVGHRLAGQGRAKVVGRDDEIAIFLHPGLGLVAGARGRRGAHIARTLPDLVAQAGEFFGAVVAWISSVGARRHSHFHLDVHHLPRANVKGSDLATWLDIRVCAAYDAHNLCPTLAAVERDGDGFGVAGAHYKSIRPVLTIVSEAEGIREGFCRREGS